MGFGAHGSVGQEPIDPSLKASLVLVSTFSAAWRRRVRKKSETVAAELVAQTRESVMRQMLAGVIPAKK